MNKQIFSVICSSFLWMSCQMTEIVVEESHDDATFAATVESFEAETKTVLVEDHGRHYTGWTTGDGIAVFQGNTLADKFSYVSGKEGNDAAFSLVGAATTSEHTFTANVALYPYMRDLVCKEENEVFEISNVLFPSVQEYLENSFAEESFLMVALTPELKDRMLHFKNVSGALRLKVKAAEDIDTVYVNKIVLTGRNEELIAGKASVKISEGNDPIVVMEQNSAQTQITLNCPKVHLTDSTVTEFIIALPETRFDYGFKVSIYAEGIEEPYTRISTDKQRIKRSRILTMPSITFGEHVDQPDLPVGPQEGDYIDEYNENHRQGIKIGETVWAPVNCGYHEDNFKYGKLYQWGRKYGQGYDGDYSAPSVVQGTVDLITGQSEDNADKFYSNSVNPYDWCSTHDGRLWNAGTEDEPIKTEYDPCPDGWRVPTAAELTQLHENYSSWTTEESLRGRWFSGNDSYSSLVSQLFLPAAGYRKDNNGTVAGRSNNGYYWSSGPSANSSCGLYFSNSNVEVYDLSRSNGYAIRCVKDDKELVPVDSLILDKKTLTLSAGRTKVLKANIFPTDANHKTAYWWSDNPKVATVDINGEVKAISNGKAIITAMAGMKITICVVEVKNIEYVDEYGKNHGKGVEIDGLVWAPVNCGYHESNFKYGKLYQWGRKYGQGYKGELYDGSDFNQKYYDTGDIKVQAGPVSLSQSMDVANADVFFTTDSYRYDWCETQMDDLWNSGTESEPRKTDYDPCPEGWRVPTKDELESLSQNHSSLTLDNNRRGFWFSGSKPHSTTVPRIFLPAAGNRSAYGGSAGNRGCYGYYWSSSPNDFYSIRLYFQRSPFSAKEESSVDDNGRADAYSIRCVQE